MLLAGHAHSHDTVWPSHYGTDSHQWVVNMLVCLLPVSCHVVNVAGLHKEAVTQHVLCSSTGFCI